MKQTTLPLPRIWSLTALINFILTINSQAQQKPRYDTPAYSLGVSHRHNFCPRLEAVERGDIQRRDALQDMDISIAVFSYQLDDENSIDPEKRQIAFDLLDEIANRSGFTWRDSYGVVDSPSENETWDELLDWSIKTYDLLGDWMIRSVDRIERGVKFPEPWYDASLIMIRREASGKVGFDKKAMTTFLAPFSISVWVILVLNFFISGIVYYLVDYLDSRVKKEKMEGNLPDSLFSSAYALTGHSLYNPKSTATRIVSFSIAFVFLFVSSLYTANMANFLIGSTSALPEIEVVYDAIKADQLFCLMDSSAADTYFQKNYPNARIKRVLSPGECYAAASNLECDICITTVGTWDQYRRKTSQNPGCKLEWIGRPLDRYSGAFSLQDSVDTCSALFNDVITVHMLDMKLDGTFDDVWDAYMNISTNQNCEDSKEGTIDSDVVNLNQMAGIFILHGLLMMMAVGTSLYKCMRDPDLKGEKISQDFFQAVKTKTTLNKTASVAHRRHASSKGRIGSRFTQSITQSAIASRLRTSVNSSAIASRFRSSNASDEGNMASRFKRSIEKSGSSFASSIRVSIEGGRSRAASRIRSSTEGMRFGSITKGQRYYADSDDDSEEKTPEEYEIVGFKSNQDVVHEWVGNSANSSSNTSVSHGEDQPKVDFSKDKTLSWGLVQIQEEDEEESVCSSTNESDANPITFPQSQKETVHKDKMIEMKGFVREMVSDSLKHTNQDIKNLKLRVDHNSNTLREVMIAMATSSTNYEANSQALAKSIDDITKILASNMDTINELKKEVQSCKREVKKND